MIRPTLALSLFFAGLAVICAPQTSAAQAPLLMGNRYGETGYYPFVIARGDDREIIENTPIELRPYRPMHFYGNTIRRNFYRGPLVSRNSFGLIRR